MFTQNKLFSVIKKQNGVPCAYFHERKNVQQNNKQIPYNKPHLNRTQHVDNMDINSLHFKLCITPFIKDNIKEILNHPINIFLSRTLFKYKEMR